ncbi:hypothetical protein Pfo_007268 [Paulownia fortunei]|nr:hypothetical protein Pfo_007268 [Paulownia fortunei]
MCIFFIINVRALRLQTLNSTGCFLQLHWKHQVQSPAKATLRGRETVRILSALPETATSVAVAATIVGAAATFLVRRNRSSEVTETGPYKNL